MQVAGIASFVPETAADNAEIEARLDLEAGFVETRTLIRRRRPASPEQATSDIPVEDSTTQFKEAQS